jgi:hypothetical protein
MMKIKFTIILCMTLLIVGINTVSANITADAASFEVANIAWVTGETPDNLVINLKSSDFASSSLVSS